jgi:PAS domain S-box-containing protein
MKSITQQLTTSILITVLVVFGGWGYWDLRALLHREQSYQDLFRTNIAERTALGLEYSLWNLNEEGTRKLLHSVVLDEAVKAAIVYDETGALFAGEIRETPAGGKVEPFNAATPEHRKILERNSPPAVSDIVYNGKRIGKLALYANNEQLQLRMEQEKMAFFGKLVFLMIVLSLVLLLVLRRFVLRPTKQLKEWVVSYNPETPRPLPEMHKSEEISVLAQAFAGMAKRLADSMNALEISNRLLRSALDNSFQLQGLLTPEGKLVDINATALSMVNATRDAVIGRYFWETPWWNESPERIENIRRAVTSAASGELVRFETEQRDTNGDLHYIDFSLKPVMGDNGEVLYLIPEGRDITERRQLERERVANSAKQKFRQLVENANDTIFTLSLSGVLTYISPNCREFLGYTAEEMIGKRIDKIVHPDDIDTCRGFIRDILVNGKKSGAEYRVIQKGGGIAFHSANGSLQNDIETGEQTIFCIARDVTRKKEIEDELQESRKQTEKTLRESQRRLADIVNFLPLATLVIDREKKVTAWNRAMEEITGVKAKDIIGKGDYEYALPFYGERRPIIIDLVQQDKEIIAHRYQHVVRSGEILSAESFIPKLGKEGVILVAFASQLYDAEGNVIGAIESIHDVTEIRHTEAELKKAKEDADSANRAKSAFLANMSHEIRTPLNAILGFSQLMQRDTSLSGQSREHLNIINRSGEHLLALINDILELSKIEAGRAGVNPVTFDLHKLIEDMEMMFRVRTDAKNLQFLVEMRDEVPQWVVGDEGKLRQVMINLLGNAVKFTDEGGISMRIGAKDTARETIDLQFEIEDTGPGISDKELENLFRVFEQASSGVKKGGTGLGLALVKGFIQLMNGNIQVSSSVGTGSIFSFTIPLAPGSKEELQRKETAKKVIGLAPDQGEIRVLVADDVETNRILLSQLLATTGFTVAETVNGDEAVAKFREWQPHIILMDMSMPVMDGYEAIRIIRGDTAARSQPVIIAITASAFREDRQKIAAAGADGYLSKPFKEFDLLENIRRLSGVSYLYDDKIPGDEHGGEPESEGGSLPSGMVEECRLAAENADIYRLQQLIADISPGSPSLAKQLTKLADSFEFEKIVDLLAQNH